MVKRIFQEVFLREVNCWGLQEGPLLLRSRLELNGLQTTQSERHSEGGCEDVVPCRSARGLGLTPGCQPKAAASRYSGKSIHHPWALCFPFPPRVPTVMLFGGLLSRDPSEPWLPGQAACLWANPWRKTPMERPPVETQHLLVSLWETLSMYRFIIK